MNTAIQLSVKSVADTYIEVECKGINDYKKWEYTTNARDTNPTWITAYNNPVITMRNEILNIYGLTPSTGYYIQVRAQTDDDQPYDGSKIILVTTSELTPQISLTMIEVGDYWVEYAASAHGAQSKLWKYSLNDGEWIPITDDFHTAIPFEVSNLNASTDYTIQVKATKQVDLNTPAVEIFSKKVIFTTSESHNDIEIEKRAATHESATFNLYTNGISYTNWEYKLNDDSYIAFTPTIIDGTNVLSIPNLRANHVYKLRVKAVYNGSHIVQSREDFLFNTEVDPLSPLPFSLSLLWVDNYNATFRASGYRDDVKAKAYSTVLNPSFDDPTAWIAIPDSIRDVDFSISVEPDTYYSIRLTGITFMDEFEYGSNVIVFKSPALPETYDILVDWEYASSDTARFYAHSDASYRIWEYSITMNPTEDDWVTIGNYDPGENSVRFTIDSLTSDTEYVLRIRCKISSDSEYVYSEPLNFETSEEPIPAYTPPDDAVVHRSLVDFVRRPVTDPVKVVQYDQDCPIVAVSLYKNGEPFVVPTDENVRINIRFGKPDRTFVYNPAEGLNADRTIAYFKITKQMTVYHGIFNPVVEYVVGDKIAASGSFQIRIDRNPIQNGDIESSIEYKTVQEYSQEAQHAAEMLQNVSADAEALPIGSEPYAVYDPETGTFHFGIPSATDLESAETNSF